MTDTGMMCRINAGVLIEAARHGAELGRPSGFKLKGVK
jgi:hypothetical protein